METTERTGRAGCGHVVRDAWIAGVHAYYDGEPPYPFVRGWDELPAWEQRSADAIYEQIASFVELTGGQAAQLSPTQKGQFVALCWIGQIYARVEDKTGSHLEEWDEMPAWHQRTDADLFDAVMRDVLAQRGVAAVEATAATGAGPERARGHTTQS